MSYLQRLSKPTTVKAIDWEAVYAENIGRIFNFMRYRVRDEALAEDLTAQTFEKAWRKRNQYRGDVDRFTQWLYTIARNVANDYFRSSPTLVPLEMAEGVAHSISTTHTVEKKLEFDQIVRIVQKLPEQECDLVALKYGAGLTNRQIAKQLGLSESNVGSILHRTILKLRQQMRLDHE